VFTKFFGVFKLFNLQSVIFSISPSCNNNT
jgi:hypothetical protein